MAKSTGKGPIFGLIHIHCLVINGWTATDGEGVNSLLNDDHHHRNSAERMNLLRNCFGLVY